MTGLMAGTLEEMVWLALDRLESDDVTRKRRKAEQDRNLQFDDLPQFAQAALMKLQQEVNEYESLVIELRTEQSRMQMKIASLLQNNARLHETIAVLGRKKLQ